MKKYIFLIIFCSVFFEYAQTQNLYYADVFKGGVTGAGFALSADGFGGGNIQVNIPSSSTIRKAYLISGRHGSAPDLSINFDGNLLTFDSTNQVSVTFQSLFGGNSGVHIIDITNLVNPSQSIYSINVPTWQQAGFNRYNEFYLYVLYENASLSIVNTYLFLNNQDFGFINYAVTNIAPINNINDVGLGLLCGYICGINSLWNFDGENVSVNNNFVGLIGGNDINSGTCGGPYGDFYYENNQLFGLSDDTANLQMTKSDVIMNSNPYIAFNSTNFTLDFISQSSQSPNNASNAVWSFFLTYTNNCDTFTTTATPAQDTICLGDSVQLTATGGATYSWFGAFGGLSDSAIANPMASPPQTTTYIVTIKNDSGCVKTEHVKIWVRPAPTPDTIVITPQTCGSPVGSLQVGNIQNGAAPFTYQLTNLQTLSTINQQLPTFNNLTTNNFQLLITDANGCTWQSDTLFVPQINNVVASFNSVPQAPFSNPTQPLGKAPMEVSFINTSQNANMFQWSVVSSQPGDTLIQHSSFNIQHFFTQGGVFEVCLIAYNNLPQCADTVCKTIFIDHNEEISIFIPNVFTPNGDNENDNFVIQLIGAELLESLEVEVFNRWGQQVGSWKFPSPTLGELTIWNGTTTTGKKASEGTYFYVVTYTTKAGETITEKGTVSLLR